MGKIISIVNHKGGVGKTMTTQNLGAALALCGKKVLMVDIDPQCNLTTQCNASEHQPTIANIMYDDKIPEITNFTVNSNKQNLTVQEYNLSD